MKEFGQSYQENKQMFTLTSTEAENIYTCIYFFNAIILKIKS